MHCNMVQARAPLPTTTMTMTMTTTTTTTTKGRYAPICFGERLYSAHKLQHRLVRVWHGGKCVPSHESAWTTHQAAVERLAGGDRHGRVAVQVTVRVHRSIHFHARCGKERNGLRRLSLPRTETGKEERKGKERKKGTVGSACGLPLTSPTTERAPPRRRFRCSLPLWPPARRSRPPPRPCRPGPRPSAPGVAWRVAPCWTHPTHPLLLYA